MLGLRAHLLKVRNRLLSDARFQRFAADFWPTRPIAHRRAEALFDVLAGFVYTQVLSACVKLEIFERLRACALDISALSAQTGLPAGSLETLLNAAEALGLVERDGARYALGAQGAALLGNHGLSNMIAHQSALWDDLRDPVKLLAEGRGEALPRFWAYRGGEVGATEAYSSLMAVTQPSVAADILDAYSFRKHRVVMDVGGGAGVFLNAVHQRWPALQLRLFDLPSVVARAASTAAPIERYGGDFLADPLPPGADLISFVRVLHDHDDADVSRLLRAAFAALAPGGRILIAEPMTGRGRFAGAYLGMYLLAMGRGRPRRPRELQTLAGSAGFRGFKMLRTRTPSLLRIAIADRGK